jgi:AraC-like DNA-binding protein
MHDAQFCAPVPGLRQVVRFYAQRQIRIRDCVVVHPVPARTAPMIEFDFGAPLEVRYGHEATSVKSPMTVVVGPQTYRRVEMHLQGEFESFVIMFQPGGLHRLFSVPTNELTDLDYDAQAVLGSFVVQARQRLGDCTSFEDRVRVMDALLSRRSRKMPAFNGISAAAHRILHAGGRVNLGVLASDAGVGMRQFERRFISEIGMRPKLFAGIARFEAALDQKARCTFKSWAHVAHQFGYYDQMHMIHDFAEFTGKTPTETLHELETVFAEQIRSVRSSDLAASSHDQRLIL